MGHKSRRVFGFDIDGVLYDWHRAAYEHVVRNMNEKRSYVDFWKYTVMYPNKHPYDKGFWYNLVRDLTLLNRFSTPTSIPETVNEIAKEFDVVYITHRPRSARWPTYWWLRSNDFPLLNGEHSLHVSYEPKQETVRSFKCDYYIDDKEVIVESLIGVTRPIGVRKAWHFRNLEASGIPHVNSVEELPELIKKLEWSY